MKFELDSREGAEKKTPNPCNSSQDDDKNNGGKSDESEGNPGVRLDSCERVIQHVVIEDLQIQRQFLEKRSPLITLCQQKMLIKATVVKGIVIEQSWNQREHSAYPLLSLVGLKLHPLRELLCPPKPFNKRRRLLHAASNIDVVKEDSVLKSPQLKTNGALVQK